jgi:predicted TIM-barrel fold metal-dependent hydrolase
MGNLILSGLLDRFTRLKFVSVESGIGWLPFLLEAIDYEYQEVAINHGTLQRRPSDYFKSNFYACFWFERRDLTHTIKSVGIDNVLFETDFPHPVCLHPIDDIDQALAGLTEAEKVKVLSGNAAKVYNIAV